MRASPALSAPLSGAGQRGIIIVGGRTAGRTTPTYALPVVGQQVGQ
jgi:hypothetical protein